MLSPKSHEFLWPNNKSHCCPFSISCISALYIHTASIAWPVGRVVELAVGHLIILVKRKSLHTHIGIVLRQKITELERGERFLMLKKEVLDTDEKTQQKLPVIDNAPP